jgi:hypothetical protein
VCTRVAQQNMYRLQCSGCSCTTRGLRLYCHLPAEFTVAVVLPRHFLCALQQHDVEKYSEQTQHQGRQCVAPLSDQQLQCLQYCIQQSVCRWGTDGAASASRTALHLQASCRVEPCFKLALTGSCRATSHA